MPDPRAETERVEPALRRVAHAIAGTGVAVLLLQAASIVLDAAARWLLATPLYGMEDVNGLLIPITVASFLPALFLEGGNVTIDLLGRSLGPRLSARLDLFGQAAALLFIAGLAWQYGAYAADLGPHHSVILELPKAPAAWAVTAFLAVTAGVQLAVVAASAARLRAGRQPTRGGKRSSGI